MKGSSPGKDWRRRLCVGIKEDGKCGAQVAEATNWLKGNARGVGEHDVTQSAVDRVHQIAKNDEVGAAAGVGAVHRLGEDDWAPSTSTVEMGGGGEHWEGKVRRCMGAGGWQPKLVGAAAWLGGVVVRAEQGSSLILSRRGRRWNGLSLSRRGRRWNGLRRMEVGLLRSAVA